MSLANRNFEQELERTDQPYAPDRKKERKIELVNACLQQSAQAKALLDKKRFRWWKNYHSTADPILRKKDKKEIKSLSNLFMPFTLGFVEQRVPRIIGKMPSFNVYGEDQEFDQEWTEAIQQMLRRDLEQANYFWSAIIHIKQAEIFGWSVRANFWRYQKGIKLGRQPVIEPNSKVRIGWERKPETYVKWDDPWTEIVDVFRCYPQPGALSIEGSDWFIQESIMSRRQLIEAALMGRFDPDAVQDLFENSPGITPGLGGNQITGNTIADNPFWQKMSEIGLYEQTAVFTGQDHFPRHRCITMWTDTEVITVADDKWLMRAHENPYRRKPYTELKIIPVPFMMEGIGCVGMLEQLQKAMNVQENQRIDAINLGINKVVLAPDGVQCDWDNFVMSPGNRISCDQPERLHWVQVPPVGPDSYQQSRLLMNAAQWLTAINDYLAPSEGASSELNRTARGVQAIQQQSGVVFSLIAELFDVQDTGPTAKHFYELRQQFQDRPRMMRVLGKKGYAYVKIIPDDLQYSPDIKPIAGSAQPQDRAEDQAKATLVFQTLWANPLAMQLGVDMRKVLENYLKTLGITDPEKFFQSQPDDLAIQVKKEHEMMSFGHPAPASGDDQPHIILHLMFMSSPIFGQVPEEHRPLFKDHVENHLAKLEGNPNSPWFERENLPQAIEAAQVPVGFGG